MTMADSVAVMYQGRVEQLGPPAELYENPRSTFVANFLGTSNLLEAEVLSPGESHPAGGDGVAGGGSAGEGRTGGEGGAHGQGGAEDGMRVTVTGVDTRAADTGAADAGAGGPGAGAELRLPSARCAVEDVQEGAKVLIGIRPEKICLIHTDEAATVPAGHNRLSGRIKDAGYLGVSWQYQVETAGGAELTVYEQNLERDSRLTAGARVVLHWRPGHTFALDAAQDAAAGEEQL